MQNKVVINHPGVGVTKGTTVDFSPPKEIFHLKERSSGEVSVVTLSELKAVFFVKDFDGNRDYHDKQDGDRRGLGKRVQVQFNDGEFINGYTSGFAPNRPGFFLFPVDPESNNDKIYVVMAATEQVQFTEA